VGFHGLSTLIVEGHHLLIFGRARKCIRTPRPFRTSRRPCHCGGSNGDEAARRRHLSSTRARRGLPLPASPSALSVRDDSGDVGRAHYCSTARAVCALKTLMDKYVPDYPARACRLPADAWLGQEDRTFRRANLAQTFRTRPRYPCTPAVTPIFCRNRAERFSNYLAAKTTRPCPSVIVPIANAS